MTFKLFILSLKGFLPQIVKMIAYYLNISYNLTTFIIFILIINSNPYGFLLQEIRGGHLQKAR